MNLLREIWAAARSIPDTVLAALSGWESKMQPTALCECGHTRQAHTWFGLCKVDPMECAGWRYAGDEK